MRMKLLYFPGCSLKTYATVYEKTTLEVLRALGFEVYELERWNCCGAEFTSAIDFFMHHIGAVRDLIRAQEMQRKYGTNKLLTLCPLCYNVLALVNQKLKQDQEFYERVSSFMDDEEKYELGIEVIHLVSVLREIPPEKIKEKVTKPLSEFNVAVYYGCKLARPKEVAIIDPEDPLIIERIIEELNASPVDWSYKTECCGAYLIATNKDAVKNAVERIIYDAIDNGANIIATVCPLCHFNLTYTQEKLMRHHKIVPVVYITELLAFAFGMESSIEPKTLKMIKAVVQRR